MWTIAFPEQPLLQPLAGSLRLFMRMRDFPVEINGVVVILKAGATTDLATIPQLLQGIIANDDPRILPGSILHDELCTNKGDIWPDHRKIYSSIEAAEMLRDAMVTCGADRFIRQAVYLAVRYKGPQWGH